MEMVLAFSKLSSRIYNRFLTEYLPVDTEEDREKDHSRITRTIRYGKLLMLPRLPGLVCLNFGLLCISILFFVVSLNVHRTTDPHWNLENQLLKQISEPSPILDEIEIAVRPKLWETSLVASDPLSIFRQEPSPEVDRAWRELGDTRPIPLTKEQVIAIGKDPAEAVRIPESWGLGSETYAGRVDVFHQIHCLDALRQESYWDYYYGSKYPGGFNQTGAIHRLHLSHCIHYLLQNILCNANTAVYTHFWTDTVEYPFPDFNIHHQCRDFGAVKRWQSERAMNESAFVHLRKPEEYGPGRFMSYRFKQAHGYFETHEDLGEYDGGAVA